jgi:hypothetical protein
VTVPAAAVLGVGLWMPGFPTLGDWRAGRRVAGAEAPPSRQTGRLRRRQSLLIGMVAEVAAQASAEAGVSLAQVPIVVGSAFGELGTTMEMLNELEADGLPSPLRFQHSVHNSAVGTLSIAQHNAAPSTSLAAGNDTVAMVLLEAMTQLATAGGAVLAIVADEPLPEALVPHQQAAALAAALVLAPAEGPRAEVGARRPLAVLEDLRQVAVASPPAGRSVEVDGPSAAILALLAAMVGQRAGRVELGAGADSRWSIALRGPGPGQEPGLEDPA